MKLSENMNLKSKIEEFVAALKEFANFIDEPVVELNDVADIRKAFKDKIRFSVPILMWEMLHMSWINKTGFWYEGFFISPLETGNILKSGFDVSDSDGDTIWTYEFGDYFDEENVCTDWEGLTAAMTADVDFDRKKDGRD